MSSRLIFVLSQIHTRPATVFIAACIDSEWLCLKVYSVIDAASYKTSSSASDLKNGNYLGFLPHCVPECFDFGFDSPDELFTTVELGALR